VSSLCLSDDELLEVTRRRQPAAQARILALLGVPYKRRPDGSLVVSPVAVAAALANAPSHIPPPPAANGLNWSQSA
jgi:hypothetical protein